MIEKKLISKNFTVGGINPKGLIIHSTANRGATAQNHYTFWNRDLVGQSAHFVSDWEECLQLIETSNRAWHAGNTANRNFLGWEICEPPKGDIDKFNKTYWNAINGIAELLKQRGWNTKDHVWSHAWASNTYKETDHQDPHPFFKEYGVTWDKFLADIDNAMKQQPKKCWVVTDYLPQDSEGYINIDRIKQESFHDVIIHQKFDKKGVWIETQYLSKDKCEEMKIRLGSLFWSIKEK